MADKSRGRIRAAFRQEFGLVDDQLLLLSVGSGFNMKGFDRGLVAIAALPDALARFEQSHLMADLLCAGGYERIGMDHFALPDDGLVIAAGNGSLHRNFMGYTTQAAEDMVAFGITSISEVAGAFAQNKKGTRKCSTTPHQ